MLNNIHVNTLLTNGDMQSGGSIFVFTGTWLLQYITAEDYAVTQKIPENTAPFICAGQIPVMEKRCRKKKTGQKNV